MRIAAAFALALCACSFTHGASPRSDAGAGGDAPAARRQAEIVSGAGRLHAGTTTIDVEIGQGVLVRKSTAGAKTISGSPAVQP